MTLLIAIAIVAQTGRVDKIWDEAAHTLDLKLDRAYHAGLFEECITLLRAMRGFDPSDPDIATNLIFMLRNVERKDEAFDAAKEFLKQSPKSPEAAVEVARFHFDKKEWQEVISVLAPSGPTSDNIGTFVMLGRAYEEVGKPKDALRIWKLRLAKHPDDPVTIKNVDRLKKKIEGG